MFSFMDAAEQDDYKDVCSAIIPGMVYLSGYRVANSREVLEDLSIRHVVRLGDAEDLKLYVDHDDVEYHTIEIKDSVRCHLTPTLLDAAIDFILSATTPVLIHCHAGVSRSATVAMAYLIRVHKKNYREAKNEVCGSRPCASPNSTFLKDLQLYASCAAYQHF